LAQTVPDASLAARHIDGAAGGIAKMGDRETPMERFPLLLSAAAWLSSAAATIDGGSENPATAWSLKWAGAGAAVVLATNESILFISNQGAVEM
jgi:hypothetical protein